MRHPSSAYAGLVLPLVLAANACSPSDPPPAAIGASATAIQEGTTDQTDQGVVAIVIQIPQVFSAICSGSLIAPNVVLTARHCVGQPSDGFITCGKSPVGTVFPTSAFYVTTHATTTSDARAYHRVREVREAPGGNDVCGFDVALLMLSDTVAASEATPLVPRVDAPPQSGETYSALGYGATCADEGDATTCAEEAGIRRRVDNLKLSCLGGQCPTSVLTDHEWLGSKDVCEGDSGGPALDQMGRVMGVASRGSDSDGGCQTPIYSRVDSWKAFLAQAVVDGAALGGYTAPAWSTEITMATPDAATTTPPPADAASPDAAPGAPVAGHGTTGSACQSSTDCASPLRCVPESPAYCAPPCSEQTSLCPDGYSCDIAAAVCRQVAIHEVNQGANRSGGCAVSSGARPRGVVDAGALCALGLVLASRTRRRGHRPKRDR